MKTGKLTSILITGCGGDIGLGLGRILRMAKQCENLIGCDIHDDHAGVAFFDACEVLPPANTPEYFDSLLTLAKKHRVEVVVIGSEPELREIHEQNLQGVLGSFPLLMVNHRALAIGFDKLKTAHFLRDIELPYPWTVPVQEGMPPHLPCIIKSRVGAGSKDVNIVTDNDLAEYYLRKRPFDVWQEYLTPDDQEYTCGLYRSRTGDVRHIIFRRSLQGGFTGHGVVVHDQAIAKDLGKIAAALDLCGSINVQLRLTSKGPVIFEINPRFSSTVVFRHLLGFQDLIWSLQELTGYPLDDYKEPTSGIRFYRTSHEVFPHAAIKSQSAKKL